MSSPKAPEGDGFAHALGGGRKHDGHKQAGMGLGKGFSPADEYDGGGHGDCGADEANVHQED